MLFSPSLNRFYQPSWEQDYIAAGDWPDDLVEVSDEVFFEFTSYKEGFVRGVENGMPVWVPAPTKSDAELYHEELLQLSAVYNKDISFLSDSYARAALIDGVSEQDKKVDIYNEYQARKIQYQDDVASLKQKYGV